MTTFKNDEKTMILFIFNQIVARFGIPKEIVTDYDSHFQNKMMTELTSKIGLRKEHSSPYYPHTNG
jgi:transposase InsO family protein